MADNTAGGLLAGSLAWWFTISWQFASIALGAHILVMLGFRAVVYKDRNMLANRGI